MNIGIVAVIGGLGYLFGSERVRVSSVPHTAPSTVTVMSTVSGVRT